MLRAAVFLDNKLLKVTAMHFTAIAFRSRTAIVN